MRRESRLLTLCVCTAAMAALLSACGHGTFTQSFVNESNSSQTLSLTRQAGMIQPGSLLFKFFGTNQLEGTYALVDGDRKVQGKFIAVKDGDSHWIKFTADDRPEWRVKVVGGKLLGPGETTWSFESATADSKSAAIFKSEE